MSQAVQTDRHERDSADEITRDDVFEVLSNQRRRYLLHYLQQNGDEATLGDVSEQVAAWENEIPVREISSDERKRVYTSLQQFHLPKLDEQNVVEFDQREGTINLSQAADEIDIYLEVIEKYDIPWSYYYLGLTAIGTLLVGLSALGIAPFASVPDSGWVVFLLVTLGVSAGAHSLLVRRMRLGDEGPPPEVRGGE